MNIINSHIAVKLLNNSKKLTLEMSINILSSSNKTIVNNNVVDQTLYWKNTPTINKIVKNNLFLASSL